MFTQQNVTFSILMLHHTCTVSNMFLIQHEENVKLTQNLHPRLFNESDAFIFPDDVPADLQRRSHGQD